MSHQSASHRRAWRRAAGYGQRPRARPGRLSGYSQSGSAWAAARAWGAAARQYNGNISQHGSHALQSTGGAAASHLRPGVRRVRGIALPSPRARGQTVVRLGPLPRCTPPVPCAHATARVDRLRPNLARLGCGIGDLQVGKSLVAGFKCTHNVPIRHETSTQITLPLCEERAMQAIATQFLQQLPHGGNVNAPATADNGQVVQPEEPSAARA